MSKKKKCEMVYEESKDVFFAKMSLILLLINPFQYFIGLLGIRYIEVISSSALIILMLIKNRKYLNNFSIDSVSLYLFFSLAVMISGFSYQDYLINWIGIIYFLLFSTLPWYVLGRKTINYKSTISYLTSHNFVIFLFVGLMYLHKSFLGIVKVGDMGLSYAALPIAILSTYALFSGKKKMQLIYLFFSLFIIVTVGSRGPLLAYLAYVIIYMLINFKKHYILVTIVTVLGSVFYFNFYKAISYIVNFLAKKDIYSRTLYKILDGTITSGTGRDSLFEESIYLIRNNPFTGVGIGVERIHIFENVYSAMGRSQMLSSSYPHNLFIELIVQFGVVIGLLISAIILVITIKAIFTGDSYSKNFALIFFGIGFMQLMVSSSYLLSPYFFYFIGIAWTIAAKRSKRKYCVTQEKRRQIHENCNNTNG
ncbi:O-antigen ligase family protein [Gudongella sp. SC589]|uniref:O-antigen ligase family protein n=1 Tax=Gudongella sp. SC589 TaxID=3385990 RepID=UPI0039046751